MVIAHIPQKFVPIVRTGTPKLGLSHAQEILTNWELYWQEEVKLPQNARLDYDE